MVKIAYLATTFDVSRESGVLKKIISQMKTWISQGHEVEMFVLNPQGGIWEGVRKNSLIFNSFVYNTSISGLFAWHSMLKAIRKWYPDIIYYRSGVYYPSFKALACMFPIVAEINSYDVVEYKMFLSQAKYFYHRVTRKMLFAPCAGLVCVTNELANRYSCFDKPTVVIANGIDLANYAPLLPTNNEVPRLVFLGSPGHPWHGIDKIIMLARLCPEFNFDVIGYNANDVPYNGQMPSNIKFHGLLNSNEYASLLAKSDVAIGTLSLHVKNMNEASPLKIREYLAHGLPVIIGYKDTDFPNGASFLLELPNCEDNIINNVQLVKAFVYQWKGKRVPRNEVLHIDASRKETDRLVFLEKVIKNWGK